MSLWDDVGDFAGSITGQTQARAARRGARDQLTANGKATGAVQQGYGQGINTLSGMYDQSRSGFQPYAQGGLESFNNLNSMVNSGQFNNPKFSFNPQDLQNTPGYQFQLQQGLGAIQNSAAARGGVLGGNTLHDMTKFSQGLADTTYQNQFNNALQGYNANVQGNQQNYNNLAGLAQYGPQIAQQMATLGSQYGNNIAGLQAGQGQSLADLYTGSGNIKAAGRVGQANAYSGAAGNLLNTYGKIAGGAATLAKMGAV